MYSVWPLLMRRINTIFLLSTSSSAAASSFEAALSWVEASSIWYYVNVYIASLENTPTSNDSSIWRLVPHPVYPSRVPVSFNRTCMVWYRALPSKLTLHLPNFVKTYYEMYLFEMENDYNSCFMYICLYID